MRVATIAVLMAGGCKGAADGPTWNQDVLPIVEANCVSCHSSGAIAPFPLTTHAEAAPWALAMAAEVSAGTMPPWPPDDSCRAYKGRRGLTDAEIETIAAWAAAEAPEGDPDSAVHAEPEQLEGLSRVDLEIPMPEAYTPQVHPDDYRCFVMEWPLDGGGYVTGFNAVPGESSIAHHVIGYVGDPAEADVYRQADADDAGPGYTCFGGPGGEGGGAAWLGGWVPGSLGNDFPADTGIRIDPGAVIIIQVHYNSTAESAIPDTTSIQLSVADEVANEARVVKWLDPSWPAQHTMTIAAGDADASASFTAENPLPLDALVWSAGLHMHTLGTSATLTAHHADGTDECLLDIPAWDFHWQGSYFFEDPVSIARDDTVTIECRWDNSAGTSAVNWGEGTADEMCLGILYATADR